MILWLLASTPLFSQNNSLNFDGSDDYVSIADNSAINPASVTVEAWVYINSNTTGFQYIVFKQNSRSTENESYCLYYDNSSNFVGIVSSSAGNQRSVTSSDINLQEWNHIALTANGTEVKLYLNGILQGTNSNSYALDYGSNPLYLGRRDHATNDYLNGKLDDVRIWDDIRTEAEIRDYMHKELTGTKSNLIANYKLNETTGATADNAEGTAALDGTLHNMANSDWETSPAFFGPKYSLDFDGTNDYVDINSAVITSYPFTLSAWIKMPAIGSKDMVIVCVANNAVSREYCGIYVGEDENGRAGIRNRNGGHRSDFGDTEVDDDKWHHIVGVFENATSRKLYVDGMLEATSTTSSALSSGLNVTAIGRWADSSPKSYFDGQIDEVRIWNTARTEAQIRENMYKSLEGTEAGLVAYYRCDNVSGTTLQDFAGQYDGTLTNMADADWVSSSAYNTWLNTNSSAWATAANWSSGSIPSSDDNIGIYDYSGGTSPVVSGTPTVSNIFIGSSADLSLSSGITVNNNLLLYGDIDLIDDVLTIASTGYLYEEGGVITGSAGYISNTQTLNNNSSKNVGGLGAVITTSANMGSTTIERYHIAYSNATTGDKNIKRYYKITPTTNTGLNATLVFHYEDSELNANTEANLILYKSIDNGVTWTEEGGSLNTTDNTITLSSIDGFSWWTAAESGKTLPITLLDFSAFCNDDNIELNWTTASESNNSHFEIQQSDNAIDFETIGKLNGAINSNVIRNYSYIDYSNNKEFKYYRLKQVDLDGKYSFSRIITNNCNETNIAKVRIYPNPFNDKITILFDNVIKGNVNIVIKNITGTVIFEESINNNKSILELDIKNKLSAGIYFITITNNNNTVIHKIVKN